MEGQQGPHGYRLACEHLGDGDRPDWSGPLLFIVSSSPPCCGSTVLVVGDAGTYSRQQTLDNTSPGLRGADMARGPSRVAWVLPVGRKNVLLTSDSCTVPGRPPGTVGVSGK